MTLSNSPHRFGAVSKTFHWLTALLIATAFPLGLIANGWPLDTSQELATKATLFSVHKTLGVATFAVGLARILWALTQPRPAPLHPERRKETALAETIHWALYAAMVLVPLTGWIHHAATTGFAPIWWPLGQTLPLVPQTTVVAEGAAALHWLFTKLLLAAVVLHVAGALKHHLLDRDDTLRRMLPGRPALPDTPRARRGAVPAIAALAIYAVGGAAALALADGAGGPSQGDLAAMAAPESEWQVQDGSLELRVTQMGSEVTGSFGAWRADITFDERTREGTHGEVEVVIDTTSVRIGSVTEQARGPDFLDVAEHPSATFTAEIRGADTGFVADGTLSLSGAEVPVTLPFTLDIQGDTARMQGATTLNRLDFDIGESHSDPETVGHAVEVLVELTATRAE